MAKPKNEDLVEKQNMPTADSAMPEQNDDAAAGTDLGEEITTTDSNNADGEAGQDASAVEAKSAKTKSTKEHAHGAKHRQATAAVDKNKSYPLAEALELAKASAYTKFDATLDVHVRLTSAKKNDEVVRGTVNLPHGTGRERRVIIITEELIEKIAKGWTDFDVAVAAPDMMPKLAKLAKVLGPKGLMPNPKVGTVTSEPERIAEELKGGRVEFKADTLNNVHQAIGKVSWDNAKLMENFQAFIAALPKSRIKTVTLAPTMGAGVRVQL